jgi:hypothetical protein
MTDQTNTHPLVSIVIPVYNGSNYLHEAIASALNQSYPNFEVIVVNDGSTDNGATRDIATSFGDKVRYFEKENGGVATALNLAIRNAHGEYVSWLSHDDLYFPEKVEKQVSFLNTFPNRTVIIYSDVEILVIEQNAIYSRPIRHLKPYDHLQDMLLILFASKLHGCSLLIPKTCFADVGYFNERLRTTQDYDLWFKFLKRGYEFKHIPEILVRGREHKEQGSISMRSTQVQEVEDMHLHAAEQFFDNIVTFPAHIVFDIVTLESRVCKKCATYIVGRIQKGKPVLYWYLYTRKVWAELKRLIRACFRPLRPHLIRLGIYHPQDAHAK